MNSFTENDFVSRMDLITRELFPLKSVEENENYIQSTFMDFKREPLWGQSNYRASYLADIDLSDYVTNENTLGPYEKNTLSHLLIGPGHLLAIIGGSGSGKSSSLNIIKQHLYNEAKDAKIIIYNVNFNIVSIFDETEGEVEKEEQQKLTVLTELDSRVASAYDENFDDETFIRDTLEAYRLVRIPQNEGGLGANHPIVNDVITHCKGIDNIKEIKNKNQAAEFIKDILVNKLKPGDRTKYYIALMEVHHKIESETKKTRSILIVDNIDPLHGYLQEKLMRILLPLSLAISFKIVIPVRLSTFENSIKAHPFMWFTHSGAVPVDIAFTKLLFFIIDPNICESYESIKNPDLKKCVYYRATELWLRLFSYNNEFRLIIESCSGNNIRTFFILVSRWLGTSKLCVHYPNEIVNISKIQETIFRYLTKYFILETERTTSYSMRDEQLKSNWNVMRFKDESELATSLGYDISKKISVVWAASLKRLIQSSGDNEGIKCIMTSVINNLPDGLKEVDDYIKEKDNISHIASAVTFGRSLANHAGRSTKFCSNVHKVVLKQIKDNLSKEILKYELPSNLIDSSFKYIKNRLDEGISADLTNSDIKINTNEPWRIESPVKVGSRASKLLDVNSPFMAAKVFLEEDDLPNVELSGNYTANLFGTDDRLLPICLRLIYLIGERKAHRVPVSTLIYELERHFYNETDILMCINKLINVNTRLIWLEKRDNYLNLNYIKTLTRRYAYFSSRGKAYYESLVSQPTYIQHMLSDFNEIKIALKEIKYPSIKDNRINDRFTKRLWKAQLGLRVMVDFEYNILTEIFKECNGSSPTMQAVELNCQSASGDVFSRSIWTFIKTCFSHIINLKNDIRFGHDREDNITEVVILMNEWINYGRKMIKKHEELFNKVNIDWQFCIEDTARRIDKFKFNYNL